MLLGQCESPPQTLKPPPPPPYKTCLVKFADRLYEYRLWAADAVDSPQRDSEPLEVGLAQDDLYRGGRTVQHGPGSGHRGPHTIA